jgi:flagellar motor switch protein FliG
MATAITLNGTQKAALVLMQLGRERAANILSRFEENEIEELTAEIIRMERVDRDTADQVIQEFHQLTLGGVSHVPNGGVGFAQRRCSIDCSPRWPASRLSSCSRQTPARCSRC